MQHKNIVELIDTFEAKDVGAGVAREAQAIYIVMELLRGGELFDRICGRSILTEEEAFRIIYPLSIPMLATIAMFVAVGLWNSWFSAQLYMRDENWYPLQLIIRNYIVRNSKPADMQLMEGLRDAAGNRLYLNETGIKMACAVVSTIPMLLIYPFIQKYFESGVTIGAVKG